jgi:hypothetical protein
MRVLLATLVLVLAAGCREECVVLPGCRAGFDPETCQCASYRVARDGGPDAYSEVWVSSDPQSEGEAGAD